MLKAGIVGLPNVGKSTLFNALIRAHKAPTENYPFCTIEPNVGVVTVPEPRLEQIARVARVSRLVPAAIEFVDIAGLVKGASRGEGLGNKFLSHIREVDAIVHVVRCFDDPDVVHLPGAIDPVRDIEIVTTELILADLEAIRRRREKIGKEIRSGDKHAVAEAHVLDKLEAHLSGGKPANTAALAKEERLLLVNCPLLTDKPIIFAANVKESDLATADSNGFVNAVRAYARAHHACETVVVCAKLESDLADLSPEEAAQYLAELGVRESGVAALIRRTYELLGVRTFFTFNETEVRAWTVPAGTTAVKAAGRIHSDFERGFIKAERIHWKDLVEAGSVAQARAAGHYSHEGRDYEVRDGDVLLFKFNV
ncbi:MAG: redox-regulated ATPase YchF [Verrucomicrobiae bacterium]|nr:redox-regulated ATPase YchF [Verrucomicrobiae bacterium]MCX7722216.1 redox-regulated ATPase YchF [Verrucomicrobiae bacterium]MDW7978992.1 redox-regulated ATPase YchF [Verrucomicrobiales bacterium]